MRTILLSLMIFGVVALAAQAGETTGAQYADPLGLPEVLDNSGGAGISVGVQVQPATGSSSSGKRLVPAASFADDFPDRSPGYGDPGIGSGLWVPPGTTNRIVADGSSSRMSMSYVPGCLNGGFATDSSSGCALKDNYNGFRLGGGKTLMVRYRTPSTVADGKGIKVGAWNGGNVGVGMLIWLSADPTSTYSNASQYCKAAESGSPAIATASRGTITSSITYWGKTMQVTRNYCALRPNTLYYFGIKFDEAVSGAAARFQIDEMNPPFLP